MDDLRRVMEQPAKPVTAEIADDAIALPFGVALDGMRDVADALTLHAFFLALGLAAAFSTVLLLGAPFIFRWMGGQGEMLASALAYSNAAFSGA